MIKQIPCFATTDGKTFLNATEAEAHQVRLDLEGGVIDYVDSIGLKKASRTMAINTIFAWEAHKRSQVPEADAAIMPAAAE